MQTKRIRVLHVAECVGGVDRYLQSVLKYMDHDKYENIMVLSTLYKKKGYEKIADKVEIVDIPHGMGLNTIISAKTVREIIKEISPDVVYAHSSIAGAVSRLACIGLGCKVIYNPHGWSFNMQGKKTLIFVALEKLMAHFCDAIVCISDAEKKSALDKKICKGEKLHVIYNGIDLDEFKGITADRKDLHIPENVFVVGMVGRISQQKAPDVFVKMAAEIKKSIKDCFFIIVGDVVESDAKEKAYIENLAEELGVNLMITGWVDNPLDYVEQFDVACLLSRWEGFGLAIPEYMLCGKPIVATKVDAIPYLINDGVDGVLVNVDDYIDAAEKVINLHSDFAMEQNMISNAKVTVANRFDAKRVAKETQGLILNLLRR
jgi:glycosyltransferase involved in cell wall biosynthesis